MRCSIIIPTLNEATRIVDALQHTQQLSPPAAEILVVDGGSQDDTVDLVRQTAGVTLLTSPRGRAHQMNTGTSRATGDVLLFLHADCWLEPDALAHVEHALQNPRCVGGCFQQRIEHPARRYRALEWGNALRVKLWGLAYGDQGIFVRKTVFDALAGFPPLPLMEDLFFMKQLRRQGQLALLPSRLHVSARRWEQTGVVRQTARNWWLTALAQCGVAPEKLIASYPPVR